MAAKDPRSGNGKSGKGWRRGSKSPASGGRLPGQKAGGWTKRKDQSYERAALRHRIKIAAWTLALLGLVASFIIVIILWPVRTPFLAAAVTVYDSPFPPNAWAREDLELFKGLNQAQIAQFEQIPWKSREAGRSVLRDNYNAAVPGGPDKNLIIVYLSAHGVVDEKNEPCLIPSGASPLHSDQWLPIRDLIKDLSPATRKTDGVKTLLILDANRIDTNWSLGQLHNGFADRLKWLVEDIEPDGLVVLNSTRPGQIGWTSPELGNSVFAFFLWQGLRGAADAEKPGDGDGVVSLRELNDYLSMYMNHWVAENRADTQQPMLIAHKGESLRLVNAQTDAKTRIPESKTGRDPRWEEIGDLWDNHKRLRDSGIPYMHHPLAWEKFQRGLLRLEELVLAGSAYEQQYKDLRANLTPMVKQLEELPGSTSPTYNLPLTAQLRQRPDDTEIETARGVWDARSQEAAVEEARAAAEASAPPVENGEDPASDAEIDPKSTEDEPAAEAVVEDSTETSDDGPALDPDTPYDYLAAVKLCCEMAETHPTDRAALAAMIAFADRGQGGPSGPDSGGRLRTDLVELHFLRMVERYADWGSGDVDVSDAFQVRRLAELAAAPSDGRIHYTLHNLVDQADQQRRWAEDAMMIGSSTASEQAAGLWRKATADQGGYREAIRRAERVRKAFALRDQAFSEIPSFARWLLHRSNTNTNLEPDELISLIRASHTLGTKLDMLLADQLPSELLDAEEDSENPKSLKNQLDRFTREFERERERLSSRDDEDQETLRDIGAMLTVPQLTGSTRRYLRNKYLDISAKYYEGSKGQQLRKKAANSTNSDSRRQRDNHTQDDPSRKILARLANWPQHPALEILSPAAIEMERAGSIFADETSDDEGRDARREWTREDQLKTLAAQGGTVRELLISIGNRAGTLAKDTSEQLTGRQPQRPSEAETRLGLARADRLIRAAAPIRQSPIDPTEELRALDLHYLLLWHARRTVDDFWGPNPDIERAHPFFEIVAEDYRDSARQLWPSDPGQREFNAFFDARKKAAKTVVRPKEPEHIFYDDEGPAVAHSMTATVAEDLPQGKAAIFLQGGKKELFPVLADPDGTDGIRLRRLDLSTAESGQIDSPGYWIAIDDRLRSESGLKAVTLFRGHLRSSLSCYVQTTDTVEIAHKRKPPKQPTIVVEGHAGDPMPVMLILDCSHTMRDKLQKEGAGVGSERPPKSDLAKDVVLNILDSLIDQPYRVGLMAYGHRTKWHQGGTGFDTDVPGVHPNNDVEIIFKPQVRTGRIDPQTKTRVRRLPTKGETPLYLSIIKAMEALPAVLGDNEKHVIVITDGFNDQWRDPQGPAEDRKRKIHVADALKLPANRNVRLDIVMFDKAKSQLTDTEKDSLENLDELVAQSHGRMDFAADESDLIAALRSSLPVSRYVVRTVPNGDLVTPTPLQLKRKCTTIPDPAGREVEYTVELVGVKKTAKTNVTVEGGEALELFIKDELGERRLVHQRYEKDKNPLAKFDRIPYRLDDLATSLFVGVHESYRKRDGDGQAGVFEISIQNGDERRFSPRPKEAWIRIQTVSSGPDSPERHYVFYDLDFVPNRPVPVLMCQAPQWPHGVTKATIELWAKFKRTDAKKISVRELRGASRTVDGIPEDITFRVGEERRANSYEVRVTQRHGANSPLDSVKVDMDPRPRPGVETAPQRPPDEIKHRYDTKNHTVAHTFVYSADVGSEIGDYQVYITPLKDLKEDALSLPTRLTVPVPKD